MKKQLQKILDENNHPFIYAVTDELLDNNNLIEQIKILNSIGVNIFQLRQKKLNDTAFIKLANYVKQILTKDSILIINDNVNVALAADAHGIHIGQDDIDLLSCRKTLTEQKIIGVSVHNLEQALFAQDNGADYIGVGSMFNTTSKDDIKFVSMSTLTEISENIKIPIVVIGGININNIDHFKNKKIDGIAMIGTFFKNENYQQDTLAILDKISKW